MSRLMIAVVLAAGLAACSSTQHEMYYWGSYEQLIYDMYASPGKADPGEQILKLTQDIQRASDKGKAVPPGLNAHLGFMYAAVGNLPQARAAFLQEKVLFPESSVLIDGFMARAMGGARK